MINVGLERSLPREFYLDQRVFDRERAELFQREWFCAGRVSEIPQPGDYVLRRVGGECIIVTRTRDGGLRAFHNVCRHRGAELVNSGGADAAEMESTLQGRFPGAIRCPYHSWTYELDGALRLATLVDDKVAPVKGSLSLYPAGLETWAGFFFINIRKHENGGTGSLLDQLGPIPERVRRYPLADLVTARRIVYETAANWKVILENYNECYHCGPVHPELCDIVPAFRKQGGASLDWDRGIPHRPGADTFTFSGNSTRPSFPGLNEDEKIRHKGELIYPNLMLSLAREHAAAFRLWPLGPDRTTVVC
ncbi:MAG: aromatic ring-hydroxylating oxygenase subunit alpha, partial [Gammaproteobacteria bacterium]